MVAAANDKHGKDYLTYYDLPRLRPVLRALTSIDTVKAVVSVACSKDDRFVATIGDSVIAVCAVKARELVNWPGIEDRSLFDLNLRHQLNCPRTESERNLSTRLGERWIILDSWPITMA